MNGRRLLRSLRLRNVLSYGPEAVEIDLQPLNVVIGPNASGKSNLLEAIALVSAAPRDLTVPIREGGGVAEWIWKGGEVGAVAEVALGVESPPGSVPLRHRIRFANAGDRFEVVREAIESEPVTGDEGKPPWFYRYLQGRGSLQARVDRGTPFGSGMGREMRQMTRNKPKPNQSILSQLRDPSQYPELTYLAEQLEGVRFYRDWHLGRRSKTRQSQPADLPDDFLLEDASNLGLVLNDLEHQPAARGAIAERLRVFWEDVEAVTTKVYGGRVQIVVHERGGRQTPCTRLSDGTLRYLCLLAILCHPEPPPLVCLEEPELGMHPDILPTIVELLVEASQRTQLIVTTHSDVLVSALTETPEAVIVCERGEAGSRLERLDPERLRKWLEEYSLGDLWLRGQIGGTRW